MRKGFLAKCKRRHIRDDLFMILDEHNTHRATVNETSKTIKVYWDNGHKYHSQLIRDLWSEYKEEKNKAFIY